MSIRNLKPRLSEARLHPNVYRLIIGAAALYLLFLLVANLVRFARSTTDENIFRDPPSRVYLTRAFPVLERLEPREVSPAEVNRDSVHVGDLLVSLNGERVTPGEIDSLFGAFAGVDTVRLDVFRTSEDRVLTFRALRSAIPTDCFQPLPSSVYVMDVAEGGVSDLAGMRKGDLILRINGRTFSNAFEADAILRRGQSGDTVAYDILRHGEHITLPVTLASFGIQFAFLVVFLTGLVYLGTGAFIALSRPGAAGARLVGLAFICMGFLLGDMFLQRASPSGAFETLRLVTRAMALVLTLTFWLHGKFYFPMKRPELLAQRWAVHALYLLTGVALLLLTLGIAGFLSGTVLFQIVFFALLLGMAGVTFWVHWRFRRYRSKEYTSIRRLLRVAAFSATIAAGGMTWYLLNAKQFFQVGYIGLPLLLVPLSYLYVIGRYQLLDLWLRVRRNILYLVVTSVWIVSGIVALARILLYLPSVYFQFPNLHFTGTSVVALETPPDPAQQEFFEKVVLIALSLALTFVFVKIIKLGQRFIDRKFYRAQHNYNRAANELTEVMATRLEMNALAEGLVQKLALLLQLKRVGILIFEEERVCCAHAGVGFAELDWDAFCRQTGPVLVAQMQRFRSETRFSTDALPDSLKQTLEAAGIRQIISIRFKSKLVGSFVLGEKRSESPLDLEDLTFLSSVSRQVAIALENAFLYEELAEQERLKHELEIARRIQMASLPQSTPEVPGLDIAGVSIPAREVGGDYFDYLDGGTPGVTVIVGDVSGKGTSAALYMSKIQGILRSLHQFDLSPRELFVRANQLLLRDLEKKAFITAIGARFKTEQSRVVLARAGHLPLFCYRVKSGKVELITPRGMGLGLDNDAVFANELEEKTVTYGPDDVFLFVTDGVTEAQTEVGRLFGEEKLARVLAEIAPLNAAVIRDRIVSEVKQFVSDALPHDDQTVVVVKARAL